MKILIFCLLACCANAAFAQQPQFIMPIWFEDSRLMVTGMPPYCYTLLPTHEAFDARQITLSPNPARDRLKVVSAANVSIREIRLLSLAGQELALRSVDRVSCELPMAGLPAGGYYLLLTMNDGSQCHKRFVKS